MKQRLLLLLTVLLTLSAKGADRPNILFIIADDLGWADVGYHGSDIRTPNIDALCRNGVELDRHYVTPMCSSTRACLLSGRYSTRFGFDGATNELAYPLGMPTLATGLREQGYFTALTGKWHLGSRPEWGPQQFGFDQSYGSFAGGVDQYLHIYKSGPYARTWHRNHEYVEEEGHATDLIAREAVRWIESEARGDRPFYIQVAFTAVHIPIQEPEEWVNRYPPGKDEAGESRRRYAACATHMDHTIGLMVEALKKRGELDNTLIIFTSDNGGSGPWDGIDKYPGSPYLPCPVLGINEPLRGQKGQVYEGGVRVPAFAHWPAGLPSGTKMEAPIHMVDWMPTLLKLTGSPAAANPDFDGTDVLPLLLGKAEAEPRPLYFKRGPGRALTHGDWKLVSAGEGKRTELFNLASDPHEEHDLSGQHPGKVAELKTLLKMEEARDGPRVPAEI